METKLNTRELITILSVYKNCRTLGRVDCSNKSQLGICKFFIGKLGLKQKTVSITSIEDKKNWRPKYLIYIAQKENVAGEAVRLHHFFGRNKNARQESTNIALGKLYGYPDCCIQYFLENNKFVLKNDDLGILFKTFENSGSSIFSIYTNRFSSHHSILHLPHSFKCKPSVEIGKQHLAILKQYNRKLYKLAAQELNCCILEYKNNILLINSFIAEKEWVVFNTQSWCETLIPFKFKESYNPSLWLDILSPFKSGESYKIKFIDSGEIKVMIFSRSLI